MAQLQADESLMQRIVSATQLGWSPPVPEAQWPESLDWQGHTYRKDHLTVAADGEVQCGEYVGDEDRWVIVWNG